jgi:two-component system chemotaxis response regulator CheY
MRVLIADDQKSVGTTLAHLVSECNHEVVEIVGSGLDAIQAYRRYNPDVVLMDYWMAKLNGGTACRNILAIDPSARVILVSGWAHLKDIDHSGAVSILSKPVDIDQLEWALNTAMARPYQPALEVADTEILAPIADPDVDHAQSHMARHAA